MTWTGRIDPHLVTWENVYDLAKKMAGRIREFRYPQCDGPLAVYAIPRGGIPALQALKEFYPALTMVESPHEANIFVDDIVDTGKTKEWFANSYPGIPLFALIDKKEDGIDDWVSFPWERVWNETGPEENIRRIIEYIGDDPEREGLIETPSRVVKSYAELFSGYQYKTDEDVRSVLKVFEDGACDEMVLLKDIEFVSHCEHHLLPFTGKAHVAYLPNGKVVGISKIARIVDIFARRLQIQERLTQQITATLDKHLIPNGSACVIEAHHTCMSCRGVGKQNSTMVTSSITGAFREPEVRAEFFSLIRG